MNEIITQSSNLEAAPIDLLAHTTHTRTCCLSPLSSLDRLLHPDHGVSAPVEQDVGRGVRLRAGHQLLSCGLDDAVVTVKPGRVA